MQGLNKEASKIMSFSLFILHITLALCQAHRGSVVVDLSLYGTLHSLRNSRTQGWWGGKVGAMCPPSAYYLRRSTQLWPQGTPVRNNSWIPDSSPFPNLMLHLFLVVADGTTVLPASHAPKLWITFDPSLPRCYWWCHLRSLFCSCHQDPGSDLTTLTERIAVATYPSDLPTKSCLFQFLLSTASVIIQKGAQLVNVSLFPWL